MSWSPDRLAREINRTCGAGTISVKAPYNWVKGSVPRRGLPHVVARILSERLGEPVTPGDLWPDRFPGMAAANTLDPAVGASVTPFPPPSAEDAVTAAVDWLVGCRPPVAARTCGEEVGPGIPDALDVRVAQLRRLDDDRGGRLVMDWAVQELRWTRRLVAEGSYDHETGRRLYRAGAELAQLAGWTAFDLGMHGHGSRYLLAALRSARNAGDRALAAYVVSSLSYQSIWQGQGRQALRLAQISCKGAETEPAGAGRALLASRQARAYAAVGDGEGVVSSVAEACELIQAEETGGSPPWSEWVTPAVLFADAGRAWLDMGRPDRAEQHLVHALELFGDTQPRNRLLHWTSLAEARLGRGDVEGAVAATEEALGLYGQVASERARLRLTGLRDGFARCDGRDARRVVQHITLLLSDARPLANCG
ncbi:hypothetical protein AC230_23790 [Streptomyces caatingaensis]|uniref:Uncharacterized protein n=1 Tax=Streptomyces caatingaensis TaxID=1678637 RepID=A0A0K9XA76_9ACTN|nr:hypothetical protein AC230_23790 [Streptomyces caatingaensis]